MAKGNEKKLRPIEVPKDNEDKKKALQAALNQIQKDFGKGVIMRMGDMPTQEIASIPTGSVGLDVATGIGGVPRGRVVEIYGPESSGKTTLTLHIIAEAQKAGGTAAFIDAEHALDINYAKIIGVDVDNLLISQPDTGDQALEICDMLTRSGAVDVIVIDSVAALVPKAEILGEMSEAQVGMHARLMSKGLRKLTGVINKTNTCVIFINQLREKIGTMYGNPETTTGGRALKFYASMRMEVRKVEVIKQGENGVGNRTRVKIIKNKMAPPFKEAMFDIMFGEGISKAGDILELATELDIIDKAGSWYNYEGEKLGQGRENAKDYIKTHPEIMAEIEEKIKNHMNSNSNDSGHSASHDDLEVDEDGVVIEDL